MYAIEARALTRSYGRVAALAGLSLRVAQGECYGLLGPNGAGKSTLLHVLLGFLQPDSGQIRVMGMAAAQARQQLGYLPERMRLPLHTTPTEYLHDLGRLSGLSGRQLTIRCQELLEQVGLLAAAKRRIGGLSKGMQQRLGIAQAILHDPRLLLIDEPSSGLDPAGQQEMLELLAALRDRHYTMLICSHQLHEIEQLCDRVGILRAGQLVCELALADTAAYYMISISESSIPASVLASMQQHCPSLQITGTQLRIPDDAVLLQQILRCLLDVQIPILEVHRQTADLLELYQRVISPGT